MLDLRSTAWNRQPSSGCLSGRQGGLLACSILGKMCLHLRRRRNRPGMVGAPRRNASTSEEERSRHTVHDHRLAPIEGAKC
jgi:hypothetical protein